VLDHLPTRRARLWVDANGHATTTTLAQISPSQRLLGRIHVARGFTAYQHYGAVCDLPTAVNKSIRTSTADSGAAGRGEPSRDEDTSPHTPALIVAPAAVDAQYRADDTLGETHAETLQARTLARLATYADGYDIRCSLRETNETNSPKPVATVADHHLECEQTRMGPRVVGEDFETLVYPVDDGARTTRRRSRTGSSCSRHAPHRSALNRRRRRRRRRLRRVSGRVSADGETVAATADPLLDAWTATGTGGR